MLHGQEIILPVCMRDGQVEGWRSWAKNRGIKILELSPSSLSEPEALAPPSCPDLPVLPFLWSRHRYINSAGLIGLASLFLLFHPQYECIQCFYALCYRLGPLTSVRLNLRLSRLYLDQPHNCFLPSAPTTCAPRFPFPLIPSVQSHPPFARFFLL